jgi:hypothetical protein
MDFGLLTCCALSNRNVYMLKAALLIWPWLLVKTGNELRHATVLCWGLAGQHDSSLLCWFVSQCVLCVAAALPVHCFLILEQ